MSQVIGTMSLAQLLQANSPRTPKKRATPKKSAPGTPRKAVKKTSSKKAVAAGSRAVRVIDFGAMASPVVLSIAAAGRVVSTAATPAKAAKPKAQRKPSVKSAAKKKSGVAYIVQNGRTMSVVSLHDNELSAQSALWNSIAEGTGDDLIIIKQEVKN